MFIKAEDGKIYNSDYIAVLEAPQKRTGKGYPVYAIIVKDGSPGTRPLTAVMTYAATHEEAQALMEIIARSCGTLLDVSAEPKEPVFV